MAKNFVDYDNAEDLIIGINNKIESAVEPNDATFTVKRNGTTIGSFTANSSVDSSADISVPTKVSELTNDSNYISSDSLATVATSGSYTDLSDKPTIPTVNNATLTIQKNGTSVGTFTANSSTATTANITVPTKVSDITNDSGFVTSDDLATVATSGSYTDLTDKPTIPTVNNATLTIQKNGTSVGTFTANSSTATTANITVPTKVSELTNDSGYTTNTGTITGVSVNGTSVATSGTANITSIPASILSGGIPSAVTATTQSQGDGSTKIATTSYVDTAISNLPDPMIFKGSLGTGGTITSLPAASSSNVGYTYKVITAGTYDSKAADVGDTFISDGSEWILIPSGDEPSGTVTSLTIKATSPISIDSTSAITTSGTRTISHASSGATAGSYGDSSNQTPAYGGTFKVPYVTVNATGHVTGISAHTVTIPASDNTDTKVTAVGNHYTPTKSTTKSASGGTLTDIANSSTGSQVVTGVEMDAAGHVTGVTSIALKSTNTTYSSKSAASGGTAVSLVTTGEKYTWNNKSDFSGSYTDLTDKPTIPTVNNATLTIQKNGTSVGTFTANSSTATTANITVPTKVSELTNDSGYTTNTGTVTSLTLEATSPISIDDASAITTSGTRTISHADSGASAGTYGNSYVLMTPVYGGTFKVPKITVNATGHVTGISNSTVQLPVSRRDFKCICIGDSLATGYQDDTHSTTGWKDLLSTYMPKGTFITSGVNGSGFCSTEVSTFYDQLVSLMSNTAIDTALERYQYGYVIVGGGFNDIGYDSDDIATNIATFCTYARSMFPYATIILMFTGWARDISRRIALDGIKYVYKQAANVNGAAFIDVSFASHVYSHFYDDGVHLTETGQQQLTRAIVNAIYTGKSPVIYPYKDFTVTANGTWGSSNFTIGMSINDDNVHVYIPDLTLTTISGATFYPDTWYSWGSLPTDTYIWGGDGVNKCMMPISGWVKCSDGYVNFNGYMTIVDKLVYFRHYMASPDRAGHCYFDTVTQIKINPTSACLDLGFS